MSVEENKAVARRWNEEIAWKQLEAFDEVLDKDYTHYSGSGGLWPSDAHGLEQVRENRKEMLRKYPTARASVEDIIGEGDKVAFRWAGFEKGKPVANAAATVRLSDVKTVDDWASLTMLDQ